MDSASMISYRAIRKATASPSPLRNPLYSQMISEAICVLADSRGSKFNEISNYISEKYGEILMAKFEATSVRHSQMISEAISKLQNCRAPTFNEISSYISGNYGENLTGRFEATLKGQLTQLLRKGMLEYGVGTSSLPFADVRYLLAVNASSNGDSTMSIASADQKKKPASIKRSIKKPASVTKANLEKKPASIKASKKKLPGCKVASEKKAASKNELPASKPASKEKPATAVNMQGLRRSPRIRLFSSIESVESNRPVKTSCLTSTASSKGNAKSTAESGKAAMAKSSLARTKPGPSPVTRAKARPSFSTCGKTQSCSPSPSTRRKAESVANPPFSPSGRAKITKKTPNSSKTAKTDQTGPSKTVKSNRTSPLQG